MKVFEVLDDIDIVKTDVKTNKGKALSAIVRGMKRKANGKSHEDNEIAPETNTVSE